MTELRDEEAARIEVDEELRETRAALSEMAEAEERARRERATAQAAQQAMHRTTLDRELRTLQRQLIYPALEMTQGHGQGEGRGDGGAEALWAALLAEPRASSEPPPLRQVPSAASVAASEAVAPAHEPAVTPATRGGRE